MHSSGVSVEFPAHKCVSRTLCGILILCFCAAVPVHADIIAAWNFNNEDLVANYGSGTFTSTDFTVTHMQDGESNCFPIINRVDNSYGVANSCGWEVQVDTRDFENITLSFRAYRSDKGPREISVLYSADEGSTWFEFLSGPWLGSSWISYNKALTNELDFNNVANDCANLRIRYITTGLGPRGSNYLDDLVIEGTHTPEPATMTLLSFCSLALLRRRRSLPRRGETTA